MTRVSCSFIGVSDTGEVIGAEVGRETVQNWINQVKLCTANALLPDVELVRVKKKDMAVLSIAEYPIKPVACRGRYFKRAKNANHQMTVSDVVNEHLKTFNTSWDYYVDDFHTEADISLEKVQASGLRQRFRFDRGNLR